MSLGHVQTLNFVNVCTPHFLKSFVWVFLLLCLTIVALLLKNYNNILVQTFLIFAVLYVVSRSLVDEYLFFAYNLKTWSTVQPSTAEEDFMEALSRASADDQVHATAEHVFKNNLEVVDSFKEEAVSKSIMSTIWFLRF
jgi:hypothetical protein